MGSGHRRGLERAYRAAPVTRWMGTSCEVGDGSATVFVDVREDFHHAASAVHGSIYFRLLDDAAFFAANSVVTDVLVLTSAFDIRFFRPVVEGELRAEGEVVHVAGRLVTARAELYDADDRLLAIGTGTFARSSIPLTDLPGYADGE